MHMHAISSQVEIVKVEAKLDKETGKKIVSTFLRAGEKGVCVIKVEKPLCLEKFDFMPSLGRFTLRDEGKYLFLYLEPSVTERLPASNQPRNC